MIMFSVCHPARCLSPGLTGFRIKLDRHQRSEELLRIIQQKPQSIETDEQK